MLAFGRCPLHPVQVLSNLRLLHQTQYPASSTKLLHHVERRFATGDGNYSTWRLGSAHPWRRHVRVIVWKLLTFCCGLHTPPVILSKERLLHFSSDAYRLPEDNPFALPSDEEIFMLQEVERQQRTQIMESMRSLPVHMKSTFSSQIQATVVREVGLEHSIRKVEPKKR